ncbi:MAG TPA: EF-hand domain-containing protein [Rhodanobacteraceae bacterium]|nr:EF-hand domain-containing protein [Rhodanobacteraceae bacterium]
MFKHFIAARLALGALALAALTLPLDACALGASRSERAAEKMKERFATADTDHDGLISRDEADKGMPRIAAHFGEIDANGDGKLAKDEIAAYLRDQRANR